MILKADILFCARRADASYNKSVRLHSFLCGALGIVLPALFILSFIVHTLSKEQLDELLGEGTARTVSICTVSPGSHAEKKISFCSLFLCTLCSVCSTRVSQGIVMYIWDWIPEDGQVVFVIFFGAFCYLLLFLAKYFAGWVLQNIPSQHIHTLWTKTYIYTLSLSCKLEMIVVVILFPLSRGTKTLTKKEKRAMAEYSDYIQDIVKTKKVCHFKDIS